MVAIIINHLQFWPSPFTYITGEGRLWASAAEGFFLVSGLLVGYIYGFKKRQQRILSITKALWRRALTLYLWGAGISLYIITLTLLIGGGNQLLPTMPTSSGFFGIVADVFSTHYFSGWIYFLRMYAIMLLVSPLFLWMLRQRYERVMLACMALLYLLGFAVNEATLQWQVLFFGAGIIGFHLESILAWATSTLKKKWLIAVLLVSSFAVTATTSYFFTHGWRWVESNRVSISLETFESVNHQLTSLFSNQPHLSFERIIISFVWLFAGMALVHITKPIITKLFGWLLFPLGQRSLSAYCLQALLLPFVVIFIPVSNQQWLNTLIACMVILTIWLLLRIPLVQRVIPR